MREPLTTDLRFSVIIPTCRRNDALAACLDRLADGAQDLAAKFYEVIVSDDGPADGNARELIQEDYPWAKWVAGPGKGPAANRNCGAAEARGEWLAFTDDDCVPQSGWLAAYAARIDQPGSQTVRVLEGPTTPGGAKDYGPFLTAPLNDVGGLLWSCNFAIERKLFEEMGGFDAGFPHPHLEDVDLRMRLEDRKEPFPFVPGAVVAHPPRPIRPVMKWVKSQESAFYLARKRGVPASELGQGLLTHMRVWVHTMRLCRSLKEAAIATIRSIAEFVLVACHWPGWARKYRR